MGPQQIPSSDTCVHSTMTSAPVSTRASSSRVPCTSSPSVKAVGGHSCPTVMQGLPSPVWVTALLSWRLGSPLPVPWGWSYTSFIPASHWPSHLTSSSDSSPPRGTTGSSEKNWNCTPTLRRFLRPPRQEGGKPATGCPVNLHQAHQTPYQGSAGQGNYDYSGDWHAQGALAKACAQSWDPWAHFSPSLSAAIRGWEPPVPMGAGLIHSRYSCPILRDTVGAVPSGEYGISTLEAGHGFAFLTNSSLRF